jgi:hypothetical protein
MANLLAFPPPPRSNLQIPPLPLALSPYSSAAHQRTVAVSRQSFSIDALLGCRYCKAFQHFVSFEHLPPVMPNLKYPNALQ